METAHYVMWGFKLSLDRMLHFVGDKWGDMLDEYGDHYHREPIRDAKGRLQIVKSDKPKAKDGITVVRDGLHRRFVVIGRVLVRGDYQTGIPPTRCSLDDADKSIMYSELERFFQRFFIDPGLIMDAAHGECERANHRVSGLGTWAFTTMI